MAKGKKSNRRFFYGNRKNSDNKNNTMGNTEDIKNRQDAEASVENTDIHEPVEENVAEVNDDFAGEAEDTQAEQEVNTLENQLESVQQELEKQKKEYLFLMAEFDNFRKRTLKEKSELIRNAGEKVFQGLLPIVDDFERGLKATEDSGNDDEVREGFLLIYNKLKKFMEQNGVKEMESTGSDFNPDFHEAIAQVPAPSEDMKGKVLDTVEKGYMINDKVLRHAKVAVAQ